jgi:hypothetical protein
VEGKTLTVDDFAEALHEARGNLSQAAEALGIKRHQLARHVEHVDYLRAIHLDWIERAIDRAQSNVFLAVESGDYAASTFILTTLGKERGYSTKQEMQLVKSVDINELSEEELVAQLEQLQGELQAALRQRGKLIEAEAQSTDEKALHADRLKRDPGYRSEGELKQLTKSLET